MASIPGLDTTTWSSPDELGLHDPGEPPHQDVGAGLEESHSLQESHEDRASGGGGGGPSTSHGEGLPPTSVLLLDSISLPTEQVELRSAINAASGDLRNPGRLETCSSQGIKRMKLGLSDNVHRARERSLHLQEAVIKPDRYQDSMQKARKRNGVENGEHEQKEPQQLMTQQKLKMKKPLLIKQLRRPQQQRWMTALQQVRDAQQIAAQQHQQFFLKLANECLEAVETWMLLCNFNIEQCAYLVAKLKVVIESASSFLETSRAKDHLLRLCVSSARHVETFELLLTLASQIENFVHGCCQNAWIQAAMTLTNVAELVASIGSDLELCRVAFDKEFGATKILSLDQVVEIKNAEVEIVKKKASSDVEHLLARVTVELISLEDGEKDLAGYLLQRLLRVQSNLSSFPSDKLSIGVTDEESLWGRLFQWVRPAERLGKGAAATVHKATWLGIEVARKTFQGQENPDFMQEVGILGKLCHPNITSMFCCAKDKRWCAIIMELMDEDLHDLMQRRCSAKSDSPWPFLILEAVDIMLQIAEGVNYLHTQRIAHRDLKSFNILVKSVRARGVEIECVHAKVADFGLSKTKKSSKRYSNQTFNTGTNRWMAPEIISLNIVGDKNRTSKAEVDPFKCDVYSFAMVCYEILSGDEPFHQDRSHRVIKGKVLKGERPELPNYCPSLLKALIEQCWIQEPSERPSFGIICSQLKYLKYLLIRGVDGGVDGSVDANPPTSRLALPRQPPSCKLNFTELWKGVLVGRRQDEIVPICELEGYRQTIASSTTSLTASEKLADDWPSTMIIERLVAQGYMNNKEVQGKAEHLVFRPVLADVFLYQLFGKKLCAVIKLPSQTLLLAHTFRPVHIIIGMLFPGDVDVFKPDPPTGTQEPTGSEAPLAPPSPYGHEQDPHLTMEAAAEDPSAHNVGSVPVDHVDHISYPNTPQAAPNGAVDTKSPANSGITSSTTWYSAHTNFSNSEGPSHLLQGSTVKREGSPVQREVSSVKREELTIKQEVQAIGADDIQTPTRLGSNLSTMAGSVFVPGPHFPSGSGTLPPSQDTVLTSFSNDGGEPCVVDGERDLVYAKLQVLKATYLSDMIALHGLLTTRIKQPMPNDQLRKAKHCKDVLLLMIPYLLVPIEKLPKQFNRDDVDAFEKQIILIIETFNKKRCQVSELTLSNWGTVA